MYRRSFAAIDLGASSGRVEVASFDGERLTLAEACRFANAPFWAGGTLFWDAAGIWRELKAGLAAAGRAGEVAGVGVDGWGVDFALLDPRGDLLANPVSYRDPRTAGMLDEAFRRVPRERIFAATGSQFLELNTLYQLLAMRTGRSPLLDAADRLLMLPDLFAYWLSSAAVTEYTVATTTQCFDVQGGDWARPLLAELDLPTSLLPDVVPTGTVVGGLRADVAAEVDLPDARVIATAAHDTASAVAAVPFAGENAAYISLGTWSLVGAEIPAPRVDDAVLAGQFTNEGGAGGRIRLLRNVAGLWLVEECRRVWATRGRVLDHDDVARLATGAPARRSFVNVDAPEFLLPDNMPAAIRAACARSGQPVPEGEGAILRCALESLALRYRLVLGVLRDLTGRGIDVLHVVGGGSRNRLLCQLTADATGVPVLAGPAEATATGNALVQMIALGDLASLDEGRALVRRSFNLTAYEPHERDAWNETYARYLGMIARER
jgi:rhamnulokinase